MGKIIKILYIKSCMECMHRHYKLGKCTHPSGKGEVVGSVIPDSCPLNSYQLLQKILTKADEVVAGCNMANQALADLDESIEAWKYDGEQHGTE